ncbi:unnamed protein product [Boreogadus saida]
MRSRKQPPSLQTDSVDDFTRERIPESLITTTYGGPQVTADISTHGVFPSRKHLFNGGCMGDTGTHKRGVTHRSVSDSVTVHGEFCRVQ